MNLPKELTARISDHLSKVRKNLGNLSSDEQKEILQSIEAHIYDALENRTGGEPTRPELEAVLAEMDSPESYAAPRTARSRWWLIATTALALIALAVAGIKWWPIKSATVIGQWASIDFVASPEQFNPLVKKWTGDLFLKGIIFLPDGKTDRPWWTWKNGVLHHSGDNTDAKFFIKEISGKDYLFLEWISGDTINKRTTHNYYVFKKGSVENRLVSEPIPPKAFLKPVKQPSAPQPPPGKYAFQIIKAEAPAEIVQTPQANVEQILQHPDVKISEYPILIAGLGESVTNDQTEAVSMDVDYGLVDGKPVTKEKTFRLGDSTSVTANKIENGTISYHLNIHHLELNGFFESKLENGFIIKTQPRFKTETIDTDLTQKLNSWILINGIIEQRPDGRKINQITCVRAIPPVTAKEVNSETKSDNSPIEIQKGPAMKQSSILTATAIMVATNLIAGEPKTEIATNKTSRQNAVVAPPVEIKKAPDEVIATQKEKAKHRMREDFKIYSQEELQEIESLYQVANKQWRSEEGKESLRKLISKYSSANRTGCATLYLGQMSTGDEQIAYLQKAINDFSDCFYGDGAQVGAYARFVLLYRYRNDGEKEKAARLAEEIRTSYPDAIDHRGKNIVDLLKTVEN